MSIKPRPEDQRLGPSDEMEREKIIYYSIMTERGKIFYHSAMTMIAHVEGTLESLKILVKARWFKLHRSKHIDTFAKEMVLNRLIERIALTTVVLNGKSFYREPRTWPGSTLNTFAESAETLEQISDINNIYARLHEIDNNITGLQESIDDLKDSTRTLLTEIKQHIS